jgi:hypothetical protein
MVIKKSPEVFARPNKADRNGHSLTQGDTTFVPQAGSILPLRGITKRTVIKNG